VAELEVGRFEEMPCVQPKLMEYFRQNIRDEGVPWRLGGSRRHLAASHPGDLQQLRKHAVLQRSAGWYRHTAGKGRRQMREMQPSLNVNRPLGVLEPEKENAYPIPLSDWSFIRNKIRKIEQPTVLYNMIGSVLLGVAGSALLAAVVLQKAPDTISVGVHVFCWMLFAFCLLSGIGVLYFDNRTRRKYNTGTKEDVLEEMDRLEKHFKTEARTVSAAGPAAMPGLPDEGHEQTDQVPAFMVASWSHTYFDHKSKRMVVEKARIDDAGNYYVDGGLEPNFNLRKFNLEWTKRIVTFDKRVYGTDKTHSRETLHILDNGLLLLGEVKGKPEEKRLYKRTA